MNLKPFIFALLVTLGMNALDMLFHVATDTAVHLNYVAVKFTIVFVAVFLIAWLIGIGRTPGIVTSLLGPGAFYVYYRYASATIDHSLFKIDDAVWYILIHAVALGLTYWLGTRVMQKKPNNVAFASLTGLATLALHWGWIMFVITWLGGTSEDTMIALSFTSALIALAFFWVLLYFGSCIKQRFVGTLLPGALYAIGSMMLGASWIGGVARFGIIGAVYLMGRQLRGDA